MKLPRVYLFAALLLGGCDAPTPPPRANPTPEPTVAVEVPEDTPDAHGLITAVGHVQTGTVLYHIGDGERRGVVKEITMDNPIRHQRVETVIWESKYGREVVPMKYMDMYRVRPDGK